MEGRLSVPELLNPITGRIDAQRVARFLRTSLETVAAMLGRRPYEVLTEPDGETLQEALGVVAAVIGGLLELLGGDEEQMLLWLNSPHPQLDGDPPLAVMQGELTAVAVLVEHVASGAPA